MPSFLGARGVATQLGVGDTSTVDKALNFTSEGLQQVVEQIDANGMRGTRNRAVELLREGRNRIGGNITINPTPVDLVYLLPKILGGTPSGTSYPLAETVGAFYTSIDRVAKVFTYTGTAVTRATFSSSPGQVLALSMDCIASVETVGNSGTYPSITVDKTTKPFVMSDLAVTIGGTGVEVQNFSLTIDNALNADRFFNARALQFDAGAYDAMDRTIGISLTLPYGHSQVYGVYPAAITGVAVVATFTNGTVSLAFTMAAVAFVKQSPVSNGLGEIFLQLDGQAYTTSTTTPLATVLDSTP